MHIDAPLRYYSLWVVSYSLSSYPISDEWWNAPPPRFPLGTHSLWCNYKFDWVQKSSGQYPSDNDSNHHIILFRWFNMIHHQPRTWIKRISLANMNTLRCVDVWILTQASSLHLQDRSWICALCLDTLTLILNCRRSSILPHAAAIPDRNDCLSCSNWASKWQWMHPRDIPTQLWIALSSLIPNCNCHIFCSDDLSTWYTTNRKHESQRYHWPPI